MEEINTDALIIGFGKGGKTLAGHLAGRGIRTVLVEQSAQMYGGTCINIGCIPTKALVVQAERHTPYAQAVGLKDELTARLRSKNYESLARVASWPWYGPNAFLSTRARYRWCPPFLAWRNPRGCTPVPH